jgi:hypothetical protein
MGKNFHGPVLSASYKQKLAQRAAEIEFKRDYGRTFLSPPSEEELSIWRQRYFNTGYTKQLPQDVKAEAESQFKTRTGQEKAKYKRRPPCGGVIRAEKANSPAVIIKGIQYVPCNLNLHSGAARVFENLVDRHPDYFIRGEKVWALEWTAELVKALFCAKLIDVEIMTIKLDHCARLSDKEKKQFILDETMVVEYDEPEMQIVKETLEPSTRVLKNASKEVRWTAIQDSLNRKK